MDSDTANSDTDPVGSGKLGGLSLPRIHGLFAISYQMAVRRRRHFLEWYNYVTWVTKPSMFTVTPTCDCLAGHPPVGRPASDRGSRPNRGRTAGDMGWIAGRFHVTRRYDGDAGVKTSPEEQ